MSSETRRHKQIKKTIFITLCFFLSLELLFQVLERNNLMFEPYEYGNRNDIAAKVNHCKILFSQKEHANKLKVVMIGDSRPELSFNPLLFDELNNNETISYNLAAQGVNMRFQYTYITKIVIPKIKPDFIIWDINWMDFITKDTVFSNWDHLNHSMGRYYTENSTGLSLDGLLKFNLMKYSAFWRYKSLFRLDQSYELFLDLIFGVSPKTRGYNDWDKQVGTGEINITDIEANITEYSDGLTDSFSVEYIQFFYDTIEFIRDSKIPFIVVNGPYYEHKIICNDFYDILAQVSGLNFLDLNGNKSFNRYEYYYNFNHVNVLGAKIYTQFVYDFTKKFL